MTDARPWGRTPRGDEVHLCRLQGESFTAEVLTYGATLNRLVWHTPAQDVDTVLGLPTLAQRLDHPSIFLGGIVGPFANRISGAEMVVDGERHRLTANDGEHCLHGGAAGTDRALWEIDRLERESVTLTCVHPDGHGGFPGPISVTATYTVTSVGLDLLVTARTERATPVSLASHAYLNLAGGGSTDGHRLSVLASELLSVDASGIPVGVETVEDAGLDLREPTTIGELRRRDVSLVRALGGVDLPFLPDGSGMRPVARVELPGSGRSVTVYTDQACLQVYTGNSLTSTAPGHDGRLLRPGDGIALEAQLPPDAPNRPWLPDPVLRPGDEYRSATSWRFALD